MDDKGEDLVKVDTVGIVGLGYIGLTFVGACANVGYNVIGIDIDEKKVRNLQQTYEPDIYEPGLSETLKHCRDRIEFTSDYGYFMKKCRVVMITVSTPVDESGEPNLEHLNHAVSNIGRYLQKGYLLVLKSTVSPGTTRSVALKLQELTGLEPGKDFYIGFCPERTIEGLALHELYTLPKIVGGINVKSTELMGSVMMKLGGRITKVSSPEVAELCKLVDNLYRATNIAFANEIGLICEKIGLDAYEVATAVSNAYERTQLYKPGLGADGPCLSKDPLMLVHFAEKENIDIPLTSASIVSNKRATMRIAEIVSSFINNRVLSGARVALVGLAFKGFPETDDLRGSPALSIYNALQGELENADFSLYDPIVKSFLGRQVAESLQECIQDTNVVLFLTNHPSLMGVKLEDILSEAGRPLLVVDCWRNLIYTEEMLEESGIEIFSIGKGAY